MINPFELFPSSPVYFAGASLQSEKYELLLYQYLKQLESYSDSSRVTRHYALMGYSPDGFLAVTDGFARQKGMSVSSRNSWELWSQKFPRCNESEQFLGQLRIEMEDFYRTGNEEKSIVLLYCLQLAEGRVCFEEHITPLFWNQDFPRYLFLHSIQRTYNFHFKRGIHVHVLKNGYLCKHLHFAVSAKDLPELKKLSRTEFKLVETCVNASFSEKELADSLFISINTLKTHKKNIAAKLDIDSFSQLIFQVRQEIGQIT